MERLLETYSQLFTNAPIGIYIEQDSRFMYVNPVFLSSTGFTGEELKGKRPLSFVVPQERSIVREKVIKMLEGKSKTPFYFRVKIKTDEIRWIMQTVAPVQYNGRRALLGFYMDVTEFKKKDEELIVSRERLRNLTIHLQTIREQERTKIAREIHDELGQILTALKIDIAFLMKKTRKENQNVMTDRAQTIMNLLDTAIKTVQRISTELMPGILTHLGLEAAIEWQAEQFSKRTGMACETFIPQANLIKDTDRSIAVFRIFQEALTNIIRHSGATKVKIKLFKENKSLKLCIEDDGRGITNKQITSSTSVGILGMQERARFFGGKFTITGEKKKGTKLVVTIPVNQERLKDSQNSCY